MQRKKFFNDMYNYERWILTHGWIRGLFSFILLRHFGPPTSSMDSVSSHSDWPIDAVQFKVETTRIAHHFSPHIPPPYGCRLCATVSTGQVHPPSESCASLEIVPMYRYRSKERHIERILWKISYYNINRYLGRVFWRHV